MHAHAHKHTPGWAQTHFLSVHTRIYPDANTRIVPGGRFGFPDLNQQWVHSVWRGHGSWRRPDCVARDGVGFTRGQPVATASQLQQPARCNSQPDATAGQLNSQPLAIASQSQQPISQPQQPASRMRQSHDHSPRPTLCAPHTHQPLLMEAATSPR
eukprot:366150-Chlamydomonas_euryale.AAC.9